MQPIYFDNNATTRLDDRVVEAMLPYLREQYANPSSVHLFGQQAAHAVAEARDHVAALVSARPRGIIFTGSGTEANQLAVRGILPLRAPRRSVITTAVEHPSVLELCRQLEREGYRVTYLGVDRAGQLDLDALGEAVDDDTALISVMHANNETGVIFPVERIAEIAHEHGVPLHVDAVQTVGKIPVNAPAFPVSLLSMSAHKLHGPKGVGALYVGRGTRLRAQLVGGHQERDLRAGTENVAGIVGLGEAARLAANYLLEEDTGVRRLRDRLETGILDTIPIACVHGDRRNRLPNTTNIGFEALEAEAILMLLSSYGVCASSGAACSSGSLEPSHVLEAMGISERSAHGAVRFSVSRFNTTEEVDQLLSELPGWIDRLASLLLTE